MKVNLTDPYKGTSGFQHKGNIHTHTLKSHCGKIALEDVVKVFEERDYAFIAITDHCVIADIPSKCSRKLAVLPGIEIDLQGRSHFGVVHTDASAIFYDPNATQQEMIDRNIAAGALVTLHHPDWQLREHYTVDELMKLENYDGIEIYNTVIEFLEGSPLSTAKWDRLLASGRRILGFANQDFHDYKHALDCCNILCGSDKQPASILKALKEGRFYCYYGVNIKSMGREGDTISVEADNARLIRFIGMGGKVLKKVKANSAQFTFTKGGECSYVRIECLGEGEEISFSQPFFRE